MQEFSANRASGRGRLAVMVGLQPHAMSQTLLSAIDAALPRLRAIDEDRSAARASPDRWSPREELGHLIDSASNNHRRIVLGRTLGTLEFDGYQQDAWVEANGYREMPWADVVELWVQLNRHMARAVACVPADVLVRPHSVHSLGVIGFRSYSPGAPATLADLVEDYIDHLQHHLDAIFRSGVDSNSAHVSSPEFGIQKRSLECPDREPLSS